MVGRFLPVGGKKRFLSVEKTGMVEIVFWTAKNRFCHINCEAFCQNQACQKKIKK